MISERKIRLMTNAAMLVKKGGREMETIGRYRRRDYIVLHMLIVWILSTVSYLLMTAALLVFLLGVDPDRCIAFEVFGQAAILWGIVYLVFCFVMSWIAYFCYGTRYEKARQWKKRCRAAVQSLEEYYREQAGNPVGTPDRKMQEEERPVKAGEGKAKNS